MWCDQQLDIKFKEVLSFSLWQQCVTIWFESQRDDFHKQTDEVGL